MTVKKKEKVNILVNVTIFLSCYFKKSWMLQAKFKNLSSRDFNVYRGNIFVTTIT